MVTMNTPKLLAIAALAAVAVLLVPAPAGADELPHNGSVVIQVNGDVTVPSGEHRDTVIVLSGNAFIQGHANTVVVFDGTATLVAAQVDALVVMNGTIDIGAASTVGRVWAATTTYHAASDAVVSSYETADPSWIVAGLTGVAFAAGLVLLFGIALVVRSGNRHGRDGESTPDPSAGQGGLPLAPPTWR